MSLGATPNSGSGRPPCRGRTPRSASRNLSPPSTGLGGVSRLGQRVFGRPDQLARRHRRLPDALRRSRGTPGRRSIRPCVEPASSRWLGAGVIRRPPDHSRRWFGSTKMRQLQTGGAIATAALVLHAHYDAGWTAAKTVRPCRTAGAPGTYRCAAPQSTMRATAGARPTALEVVGRVVELPRQLGPIRTRARALACCSTSVRMPPASRDGFRTGYPATAASR